MATLASGAQRLECQNSSGDYARANDSIFQYEVSYSGSTLTLTVIRSDAQSYYFYTCEFTVTYNGTSKTLSTTSNGTSSVTFTLKRGVSSMTIVPVSNSNSRYPLLYFCTDASEGSEEFSSLSISWSTPNTAPTATITVPELKAGKTARISWTTSDSDGDTVKATKLVRYYKASGATSYTQTTVYSSSSGTTTKYKDDTIPGDAAEGSIYYVLTITDSYTTATAKSATVVVTAGAVINGQVTIGGVAKELVTGYVNVGGIWKELIESYGCISGVWKQTF